MAGHGRPTEVDLNRRESTVGHRVDPRPPLLSAGAQSDNARITIDAAKVEGQVARASYGQFVEFMYEGVKGGLAAELVRNRGFAGGGQHDRHRLSATGNAIPTTATTTTGCSFTGTTRSLSRPAGLLRREAGPTRTRVDVGGGVFERHGSTSRAFRAGRSAYHGYLWLKTTAMLGNISWRWRKTFQAARRMQLGDRGPAGRLEAIPVRAPSETGRPPRPACGSLRGARARVGGSGVAHAGRCRRRG